MSEQVIGQVSGPVLSSRFLFISDHSALVEVAGRVKERMTLNAPGVTVLALGARTVENAGAKGKLQVKTEKKRIV